MKYRTDMKPSRPILSSVQAIGKPALLIVSAIAFLPPTTQAAQAESSSQVPVPAPPMSGMLDASAEGRYEGPGDDLTGTVPMEWVEPMPKGEPTEGNDMPPEHKPADGGCPDRE